MKIEERKLSQMAASFFYVLAARLKINNGAKAIIFINKNRIYVCFIGLKAPIYH